MTDRLPLVRASGKTRQMAAGDSLLLVGAVDGPAQATLNATASLVLANANANVVVISGSGNITSFGAAPDGTQKLLRFATDLVTIVYGSTFMSLPGSANITPATNDHCLLVNQGGGNFWRMVWYTKADGTPLFGAPDASKLPLAGGTMSGPINLAPFAAVNATTLAVNLAGVAANTILFATTAESNIVQQFTGLATGARRRFLISGNVTFQYSGSALNTPNNVDLVCVDGDVVEIEFISASQAKVFGGMRKSGQALYAPLASDATKLPLDGSGKMTGAINEANLANATLSGSTIALGAAAANTVIVSGTNASYDNISGLVQGARRTLYFQSLLTLRHNSYLDLPSKADIVVAVGDFAEVVSLGGGPCVVVSYTRANGTALVASAGSDPTKLPLNGSVAMTGALNEAPTGIVASAATTDIGAAAANTVNVTGTTTITSLGTIAAGARRTVVFAGALTLTYNATSLILPGGTDIATTAGDVGTFVSLGSGNWKCTAYLSANGKTPSLSNVDNTSDVSKPVSTAQQVALDLKAPKADPLFTGTGRYNGSFTVAAVADTTTILAPNGVQGSPKLRVSGISGTLDTSFALQAYSFSTANFCPALYGTRSLGAAGVHGQLSSGRSALGIVGMGSDGAAYQQMARIDLYSSEATTSTSSAGEIRFSTTPTGTVTPALALTIGTDKTVTAAGNVAVAGVLTAPSPVFANVTTVRGTAGEPRFVLDGPTASNRYVRYDTASVQRWQFGVSSAAESGSNVGSNFYVNRFSDAGVNIGNTMTVDRASGLIVFWSATRVLGPLQIAQYTLSTLPSASAYSGYEIDVTDATGGSKRCRSNGTNWQILNTTTTVS